MSERWTSSDYTVLTEPDITINIPLHLTKDFIGIFILDILHDATGENRGVALSKSKLCQITDLLAESIFITTPDINIDWVKNYFFECTLKYFLEIWINNLPALGLTQIPENEDLQSLKEKVLTPVKQTRDKYGILKNNTVLYSVKDYEQSGVEAYNYHYQKHFLDKSKIYESAFESPQQYKNPSDFFNKAHGIVDIIHYNYPQSKVVLDMKTAAGLLRTITDPLTYITSLPTYADPGYNFLMSAIRKNSDIHFLPKTKEGYFSGSSKFTYSINLETPIQNEPLQFLYTTYFNGLCKDGLDRSNIIISTLGETFVGILPSSKDMSLALCQYLENSNELFSTTISEILYDIQNHIYNYYDSNSQPYINNLETDNFGENYINATIKNIKLYGMNIDIESIESIFMITDVLPNVLYEYIQTRELRLLSFVNAQYKLLEQYSQFDPHIKKLLKDQWLPKRKGKLVNQLKEHISRWRLNSNIILEESVYIKNYIMSLIEVCKNNINLIETDEILEYLPDFNPTKDIGVILEDHLQFYNPEIYSRTVCMNRNFLLLSTLISLLLWDKPLLNFDINLDTEITFNRVDYDGIKHTALQMILGKFSGDFGQIMWAMHMGHLFSSGDNNASAMALLMHRIDTGYKWGSIHESGNGNCVYITLEKTWD